MKFFNNDTKYNRNISQKGISYKTNLRPQLMSSQEAVNAGKVRSFAPQQSTTSTSSQLSTTGVSTVSRYAPLSSLQPAPTANFNKKAAAPSPSYEEEPASSMDGGSTKTTPKLAKPASSAFSARPRTGLQYRRVSKPPQAAAANHHTTTLTTTASEISTAAVVFDVLDELFEAPSNAATTDHALSACALAGSHQVASQRMVTEVAVGTDALSTVTSETQTDGTYESSINKGGGATTRSAWTQTRHPPTTAAAPMSSNQQQQQQHPQGQGDSANRVVDVWQLLHAVDVALRMLTSKGG